MRNAGLSASDFIVPFFVAHGRAFRRPIASMPGQYQLSIDQLLREAGRLGPLGLKSVLLFGIPKKKDAVGSEAWASDGIIQQAVRALKKKYPKLVVMTDLCFCEYTTHGHCGVLRGRAIDRAATLKNIAKTALSQAEAGADFVAPSGMTVGAVAAIRRALDKNEFKKTRILAYSAKYASVFYGPFRDAAGSAPQFGDRRAYQLDPSDASEALRRIRADIAARADMVMVKPALSYLDVIAKAKTQVNVPLVAYNVSGEYAMVKAAEKLGWLSNATFEVLTSIKRAGADLIISYHAVDVARQLREKNR